MLNAKRKVLFYNGACAMFGEPGSGECQATTFIQPGAYVWIDCEPDSPRPFLVGGKPIRFAKTEGRIADQLAADIGADICPTYEQFISAINDVRLLAA